ncbi:MAG: amidohydrolase family protein [Sedimentisphaerales bacterium]|nr:amidohydrolase family protein [Sedimentisphaerales bacterium]
MQNTSTITIITSFLLFAVSGCTDFHVNQDCSDDLSNTELSAEDTLARKTPLNLSYNNPSADLVIRNAKVVTIDKDNPRAQAIAFKGQTIIAVTSNEDIEKYIRQGVSKIIDAHGRLVVPGFNDAHIHFNFVDPDYIDLRYITDPKIITNRVKEAVAKSEPGELIRGGNWEHEMFYNKQWPTKELIDSVSPNNPVVLSRAD